MCCENVVAVEVGAGRMWTQIVAVLADELADANVSLFFLVIHSTAC